MPDLAVGESIEMKGSGAKPYIIKNCGGGGWSCTCPAWRNQSIDPRVRTCKHIRKLRGDAAEEERIGSDVPLPSRTPDPVDGEKVVPGVLLAESWDGESNPVGWWMSEKLDGVRAWWDGTRFLSRNGKLFLAPPWFTAGLPAVPLDGELWVARKKFTLAQGIAMSGTRGDDWRQMRYVVFDAPAHGGPFEARLRYLADLVGARGHEFASVLEQQQCRGFDHLWAEFARVDALGGEGLMLRKPGSMYASGRSSILQKVKKFHDAEATIIGYDPGEGRHKGRVGALRCRLPDGVEFGVGTGLKDHERDSPPPIGTVITFKYQELTELNVPRFPVYVGVRRDGIISPMPAKKAPAPPKKETPAPAPAGPVSADARAFDYGAGGEARYWEGVRSGATLSLRFGKADGTPQVRTFTYDSPEEARAALAEMAAEKLDDGFIERVGAPVAIAPPKPAPAPKPAAAKPAPVAVAAAAPTGGRRRFELVDGTSSKFWEVWTEGARLYTQYGKIGARGQTTIKEPGDEAAARSAMEKLIREKTGKGYVER